MPITRKSSTNAVPVCVHPGCWSKPEGTPIAPADNQYCAEHLDEIRRQILLGALRELAGQSGRATSNTQPVSVPVASADATPSGLDNAASSAEDPFSSHPPTAAPLTQAAVSGLAAGATPTADSPIGLLSASPGNVGMEHVRPLQAFPRPDDTTSPLVPEAASATERIKGRRGSAAARRRTVAVLGAFGILAAAGGWASTTPVAHRLVSGDNLSLGQGVNRANWVRQTNAMLSLTDKQLTLISLTEAKWRLTPQAGASVDTSAPVSALLARKATLQQQREQLQANLTQYNAAAQLRTQLTQLDGHITDLNRQLNAIPASTTDPIQEANRANLAHQLQTANQQRRSDQNQLDQFDAALSKLASAPLPADNANRTTALVSAVLSAARPSNSVPGSPMAPIPDSRAESTPLGSSSLNDLAVAMSGPADIVVTPARGATRNLPATPSNPAPTDTQTLPNPSKSAVPMNPLPETNTSAAVDGPVITDETTSDTMGLGTRTDLARDSYPTKPAPNDNSDNSDDSNSTSAKIQTPPASRDPSSHNPTSDKSGSDDDSINRKSLKPFQRPGEKAPSSKSSGDSPHHSSRHHKGSIEKHSHKSDSSGLRNGDGDGHDGND